MKSHHPMKGKTAPTDGTAEKGNKEFRAGRRKRKSEGDAIYANYSACEKMIDGAREKEGLDEKFVKSYSYPNLVLTLPYGGGGGGDT